jgi:tyrosine-protein phosphatase YwqE
VVKLIRRPFSRRAESPKSKPLKVLPSELGLDFHSHLLPQVDDGMASFADAKVTIEKLKDLGFSGAVITPHVYRGVFDNEAAKLRTAFEAFTTALQGDGVEFLLYLAGEYFANEYFLQLIEQGDLLDIEISGERLVLLEFSYLQETPFASASLAALVAHGFRPVVAHVERYRFVAHSPEPWLDLFARYGAILQGDIGSLAGQHGEDVRRFARWLLERKHVSIWGTDVHNPGQIERHILPGLIQLDAAGRLNGALNPTLVGIER